MNYNEVADEIIDKMAADFSKKELLNGCKTLIKRIESGKEDDLWEETE